MSKNHCVETFHFTLLRDAISQLAHSAELLFLQPKMTGKYHLGNYEDYVIA